MKDIPSALAPPSLLISLNMLRAKAQHLDWPSLRHPKFTIWGGLIALGVNQKVFVGRRENLKRSFAIESTKPLKKQFLWFE